MPSFNGFTKNKPGRINVPDLNNHILDNAPHGATPTVIANKLALRDANGNLPVNFSISGHNPNLLFNPSARLGLAGWTVGQGVSAWSTGFGSTGEGGYFQSPTVTAGSFYTLEGQKIPVLAGQVYILSGEISTLGLTASGAYIQVPFYNSGMTYLSETDSTLVSFGQGYARYIITVTVPTNATYMKVGLVLNNAAVGYAQFRKIKVEVGSIATTFSDDNTLNTVQYGSALPLAQILSGGNKKQTGSSSVTIATAGLSVSVTVTFPVSFTTLPIVTIGVTTVTSGDSGYINVRADLTTLTSITFKVNSYLAQTINFNWEATGT